MIQIPVNNNDPDKTSQDFRKRSGPKSWITPDRFRTGTDHLRPFGPVHENPVLIQSARGSGSGKSIQWI